MKHGGEVLEVKSARCEVAFFGLLRSASMIRKTQQLHFSVKIDKIERSEPPILNNQQLANTRVLVDDESKK